MLTIEGLNHSANSQDAVLATPVGRHRLVRP